MFSVSPGRFRPAKPLHKVNRKRRPGLRFEALEARDVPATGLGAANDFSAFVLNNLNAYQSDIQGRVAVGGNASLTAYGLGDMLSDSDGLRDDLIVGGNLTFTNGQVFFGSIVHGGTGTFDRFGHPNGSIRQGTVIDFTAAGAALQSLADGYAALAPTGSVLDRFGTIVLTGTNAGQNVFNVPASMLWNAFDLIINTPAGSSAIVNITGTDARMQFMGFHLEGVSKENVILNFPQATHLTFQGIGIHANVLAPRAFVEFSNGQLNGTLVASSFDGQGQINFDGLSPPFEPPCTCPPLPPSQVSGMVYFDQNEDGLPQDSEMRLSGVTVTLTGEDAEGNAVTKTATTDGGGIYIFTELPEGTYSIEPATPDGYTAGASTAGAFGGDTDSGEVSAIFIPGGQSSGGYNFGYLRDDPAPPPPPPPECPPLPPSQVSGMVYVDENADGVAQDNERRLEGVEVTLTGVNENGEEVLISGLTDAGGIFVINGFVAGTYEIEVETPAGYMPGQSTTGAFGGQSQGNRVTEIEVPGGQSSGGYNFGQLICAPPEL